MATALRRGGSKHVHAGLGFESQAARKLPHAHACQPTRLPSSVVCDGHISSHPRHALVNRDRATSYRDHSKDHHCKTIHSISVHEWHATHARARTVVLHAFYVA